MRLYTFLILNSLCPMIFILCNSYAAIDPMGIGLNIDTNDFLNNSEDSVIERSVDVSIQSRTFPNLVGYWNSSLQKAPAPVIAEIAKEKFGKSEITRCWLNLDEMWDYRSGEFTFNYKIGVDKYKSIEEKHRETWDWQEESPIHYYDYLRSFSANSKQLMLTIRRYERDILNGQLPISMEDWKTIFKKGLKHYKMLFPNITYIEVGNEYALNSFMKATDIEYYQFYKLGYQAVNEVNEELNLKGEDRILVGGPVVTGNVEGKIQSFLRNYRDDESTNKQLDFVSWHEYSKPITNTAFREMVIRQMLKENELDSQLPMFITEHNPHHFSEDKTEYHFMNAAELVKSLYYTSLYSPNMKIFPWVLYHNSDLQTRFMWFNGPNQKDTKKDEIVQLPIGVSMELLSRHSGASEILIENSITNNDIVLASIDKNKVRVQVVNYGHTKDVRITIEHVLKELGNHGEYKVEKFIVESEKGLTKTNGELKPEETKVLSLKNKDQLVLNQIDLDKNSIVFWEISKI